MGAREIENHQHYIMNSLLFGASPEMAAPFLQAGPEGRAKIYSSMVSNLANSPDSKTSTAQILQHLGGVKEGLSKIFVEDPSGVAQHLPSAMTDGIEDKQKTALSSFLSDAQDARVGVQRQYDLLDKRAGSKPVQLLGDDSPIAPLFQSLVSQKYLGQDGNVLDPETGDISKDPANRAAMRKIIGGAEGLINKDGTTSFKNITALDGLVENSLFGEAPINDRELRSQLMDFRAGLATVKSKEYHQIDPGLADKFADLNDKFGASKEFLGKLSQKDKDTALPTFLDEALKPDGSLNNDLLSSLTNLLGKDNGARSVLQMEAAKSLSTSFVGSRKSSDDPAPDIHEAAAPYLDKMHGLYNSMPDELKKSFVQSPEAISKMGDMVQTNVLSEKQGTQHLLSQSGAFQGSQFG